MSKPLYVVMEFIDGEWLPAIGGGSSTKSSIRAFDNMANAKRSMGHLKRLRNWRGVEGERRVAKFVEVEDD